MKRDVDSDPPAGIAAGSESPKLRHPRAATPLAETLPGDDPQPLAETARPLAETLPGSTVRPLDDTAVDNVRLGAASEPASKIGRFVVIGKLGQGGMGIVVSAYDPQLDRRVAIKMLNDHLSGSQSARLEREAKAMAQLNHPNVVTVHETGVFDERLYIAMEYVEGQTLGAWLRASPRSRDEILDLLMQAGRGLAAAHDVGLVHRDFKPDNVLVGKDGRARVSDFGLVSSTADRISGEGAQTVSGRGEAVVQSPSSLTQTGAVMGTPLYMAPEQHDGRVADAKADQFSFCVTLWQALCNELPYGANTYEDLVANVTGGKLRAIPRGVHVPAKLRAILARGLSADPAARWPSMQELLGAIARARRPIRWPWLAAGAVVVAGSGLALALWLHGDRDPCAGAAQRVATVWDPARKAKLVATLHATGGPAADEVATVIVGHLDRYTSAWATQHQSVCRATRVRHERSAELFDLSMRCLDERLALFDAMIARFSEITSRDGAFRALDLASALPGLGDCDDVIRLRAAIPLPDDPAKRSRIEELERRTAAAMSFDKIGQWAKARDLVKALAVEAHDVGYPPLEAKLALLRAGEEYHDGNLAVAEQDYREAAEAAALARDDERIAQSWTDLMSVLAAHGQYTEALALIGIAKTSTDRVSDRPLLGARFANAVAGIRQAQGKYAESKVEYERALALVRKEGTDNELVGPALTNLGTARWYVGDVAGAGELFEQARVWFVGRFGPHHPSLGYIHRNLGDIAANAQQIDAALVHYTEALKIFEDAHGPDHIDIAIALEPLCYAYARKGDLVKAHEFGERALAVREAKFGPDHPSLANVLDSLADADMAEHKPDSATRALRRLERSYAIQVKAFGVDHAKLPETLDRMGAAATEVGSREIAVEDYRRSIEIRVKTTGEHTEPLVATYDALATVELDLHRYDDAIRDYDRAIAAAATGVSPLVHASAHFDRARGLWVAGKHAAAIAAANQARTLAIAAANQPLVDQIEAWNAKHTTP